MGFLDGCWNCENRDICNTPYENKCGYYKKGILFVELDKLKEKERLWNQA